ncbi:MAG: AMP-binding protein, partial [Stagnimonas sp.]|nr:AMP-binding protein [Stagnimonas sp.]
LEGYGLTEGTCVSSVNPPMGDRRLGSIGLRIPGQQMKSVVLNDQGQYERDCTVGEVGILTVSGPNVFVGYRIDSQNKGLWIDCGDGQRWLNTGDLARQDAEGYFWLTGRKRELIIRGGHNIDPASIEAPLHKHPAVQIAAAVARPDAHAGELPVAYVQLKAGASINEKELLAFAQAEIGERAAWPKHVRIIEQMPLTGVGKIFKPELKNREARDALTSALEEADIKPVDLLIADDKSKGTTVHVVVPAGVALEAARKVLGQFAFPFSVEQEGSK